MGRPSRCSPEVRERGVRLVMEQCPAHPSEWAALQALEREPRELKRTREIHQTASAYFAVFRSGGTRPPEAVAAMVSYIDAHRDRFGVESIGSSWRHGQISAGSRTSRTWRPGVSAST